MNGIVYTTNKENDNKYFLSFNNKITKTKDKNNIGLVDTEKKTSKIINF